jgi:hypothetical protein
MDNTIIYVFLVAMIGVLGVFIAIAANRKSKGFRIVVLRDMRNPNKKNTRYWAMYDSRKDEYIKLYSSIFRPMKSGILPPADMSGYSFDRTVYAIQSPSGHPYDDNIVFIHLPLVGQASAEEQSISLSEAIEHTIQNMQFFQNSNFKIGDEVTYKDRGYVIKNIDFNGMTLSYTEVKQIKNKAGETIEHKEEQLLNIRELSELQNVKVVQSPPDAYKPVLANFFNTKWVMQNIGVVPVDDVNLMLSTNKNAIASFNSKLHDRAMSKSSFWTRYAWLLPVVMLIMVSVIGTVIMWYSISQDTTSVGNTATAAIQHIIGVVNSSTVKP